jgi:2,3-dihydroxybenzoate decarboxylase
MKKIALEEHFYVDGFPHPMKADPGRSDPGFHRYAVERLPEFDELRLGAMDQAGIEISVLSHYAPGAHGERDTAAAVKAARRGNDVLASEVSRHPTRYRGFAMLAMHDPKEAADELERAVRQLGFKGALLNGHTHGVYLDDPRYLGFWERVAALDVPVYLHPTHPVTVPAVYEGYPGLGGAMWGWMAETGGHALRLVLSGLFDRLPKLTIILGHMGEALPFLLWRIDSRFGIVKPKIALKKPPSHYIRENFMVTTAGTFAHDPLLCTIAALGDDRVMFSVDYPLEYSDQAAQFIDTAPVSEDVRARICYGNAARILKI